MSKRNETALMENHDGQKRTMGINNMLEEFGYLSKSTKKVESKFGDKNGHFNSGWEDFLISTIIGTS